MRFITTVLFALLFEAPLFAMPFGITTDSCNYTLSGKVLDEHDKTPLEFAGVYIRELKRGAVTDISGAYNIEGLCKGKYTVEITHLGCEPVTVVVEIRGNKTQIFYTEHHTELLKSVNITGEKNTFSSTQTTNELKGVELLKTRGTTLGDALGNINGVSALTTGASVVKPVIHGMHSNRILILNNGIRQEGQQWGTDHAPEIDPYIADKLSVVKGANAVRYGSDAIAGVVIVEPRPLRDSAGIGGEINIAGFSNGRQGVASGVLEGNFKRLAPLSWRLQGTLKKGGNVNAPAYYLKNTGIEEYNFSYAAQWKKKNYGAEIFYSQFNTTLGIFSAAHIGNLTDLQRAFKSSVPIETAGFSYTIGRPYQHVEHELFKARGYVNTGDIGKLSLTYARQYNLRYEYDKHKPLNDSIAALNRPELQLEITSHIADVLWEHKNIKSFTGTVGLSGTKQGNTYEGRYFIPNYQNYAGGVFWIERWKRNKVEIEGGVRYDYRYLQVFKWEGDSVISPFYKYANTAGTLGAIWYYNEQLKFSLNGGTAWRAPNVNELYSDGLHHSSASVERGDKNLTTERAYNFILTTDYLCDCERKIEIEVSVFHNYINGFINLVPVFPPALTIRGAFPVFRYKQVDAKFTGIDASFSVMLYKGLSYMVKTALLAAYDKTNDDYLSQVPANRFENKMRYDFRKDKKMNNLYVETSLLNVLEQKRVAPNSDFVKPPPAYMLVNTSAGFSYKVKKQQLDFILSVNNIFNESYRDYMDRFRYYTDAMGRNIVFKIRFQFNNSIPN